MKHIFFFYYILSMVTSSLFIVNTWKLWFFVRPLYAAQLLQFYSINEDIFSNVARTTGANMKKKDDKKASILVVDDDFNELNSLIIALKIEGFETDGAPGGEEALKLLEKKHYDIVIMDMMMPGINGIQLARSIKKSFPSVMTVLMSAYELSRLQLDKIDSGVVGFIGKPYSLNSLIAFLNDKLACRHENQKGANQSESDGSPANTDVDPHSNPIL